MKKNLLTICFVCLSICSIFADNNDLVAGLDAYSRNDWTTATESFEKALTAAKPQDRIEALYWLVMSETSAQNYRYALNYADAFLENAPEDERAAEVSYQKGRVLHLSGNYEKSSDILYRFIENYPEHPKVPSAYYWIGENFYAAENYTEARKIFNEVVVNYPQSGKVNEARYKIVMIDQQSVRDELSRVASKVNAASASTDSQSAKPVPEPKTDESETAAALESSAETTNIADDSALSEEEKQRNEEIVGRLTALEEKFDELTAMLAQIAEEQENQHIREQQQKEQEEAERLHLEERRRELAELKQRTKTLEKLYEQRMKGAK